MHLVLDAVDLLGVFPSNPSLWLPAHHTIGIWAAEVFTTQI